MQIILQEDIEKLGSRGDVVAVKEGYARNFLLPRKLALEASAGNLKRLEKRSDKGWQPATATFVWRLQPGVNGLEVRGVNQWEKVGRAARVKGRSAVRAPPAGATSSDARGPPGPD